MSDPNENYEDLFKQLEDDPDIQAAAADHAAACVEHESAEGGECPVCSFFDHVAYVRHLTDAFDPTKIAKLASSVPTYLADCMAISEFFAASVRDYMEFMIQMEEQYEEEMDEWDDDDDEGF